MRPGPADGLVALPLPRGEPGALWAAAGTMRAAASVAGSARQASGVVEEAWTGAAADAAVAELGLVASRRVAWSDRVVRAAATLGAYGDALDAAQRSVAALQASWDLAVPRDPADPVEASASAPELAHLAGSYSAVLADLELAAGVTAHRLRELVAEVTSGDAPGRVAVVRGWVDPAPDDAAVRRAVLAELDLVAGAERRADADRLGDDVLGEVTAIVDGDPSAVARAAAALAAGARDPLVAQALWSRLDPVTTARVLDGLTGVSGPDLRAWTDDRGTALLVALGTALATAANPVYASGLDLQSRARLDAWRGTWLAGLAESVFRAARRADGGAVGGLWVQGQLLVGARLAGLSPGSAYAATVGVALVGADRSALQGPRNGAPGPTRDTAGSGRHIVVAGAGDDPVRALAQSLEGDVEAARSCLLATLPGSPDQLVVDQLVTGRYVGVNPAVAATSMAAVARLVVEAGSDVRDRRSVQLASAFVGAVGGETRTTAHPGVFRAALAPGLGDLGTVLAAHPRSLTAALDDSATAGTDRAGLPSVDRLVRPGSEPGTWEVVLADRAAAAAAIGQLAFDGAGEDMRARDPARATALAQVVDALSSRLQDDLVAAVRAERAGDPHAVDAAAYRLGQAVGFTVASAGDALAGHDADVDTRNRALADVADAAVDKVAVPGPAGRAATPLLHLAGKQAVAAALPTGAEAAQRQATAAAVTAARDAAFVQMRSVVSRAEPWTEAQAPARWAAATGAVPFWDDHGVPLPEDAMTTAQRQAFTGWRQGVGLGVYDSVPQRVREGVDEGVRDERASGG